MRKEVQTMFAIINWKTNEFLYDTDFTSSPVKQLTDPYMVLLFDDAEKAATSYEIRECDGDFVIGQVAALVEIKRATRPVFRSAINGERPAEPVQRLAKGE